MSTSAPSVLRAFATAVVLALAPAALAASPDVWDVASVPRLARDVAALRDAQRVYLEARDLGFHSDGGRDLLRVVKMILEKADATHSPDPRLGFFYGRVLVDLAEDEAAVRVLIAAIESAPAHPDAGDAWFALAIAYARLGDPTAEIEAYDAQLSTETDPVSRAITLSNQAEGFMVAGDLDTAVLKYRASLDLVPDNALARWGLAVTLDRSGDPYAAMAEARIALSFDPDGRRLSGSDVFFVPDYDRYWYLALAMSARARFTAEPSLQALWWERAVVLWQQYLDAASPRDPWLGLARLRSQHCQRELKRVRDRARAGPPRRP